METPARSRFRLSEAKATSTEAHMATYRALLAVFLGGKKRTVPSYYAIRPLIGAPQIAHNNSDTNHLTDAPAEVDIGRQVATQSHGADFRGVRNSESLEHPPRDSAQDFSHLEMHDGLGREEDGGKGDDEHEARDDGISVPEPL